MNSYNSFIAEIACTVIAIAWTLSWLRPRVKKEIEQLKELLVKQDIDALIQDSYLEYAAKGMGFKDVEELKKKLNIKQ